MNFLNPWGLLGLSALAPIILLYFLKLRREQRVVPSTLLWKKVIEDLHVNAPFQRLRYSLLLLLQLLLASLLGFALARPFLALPSRQGQRTILLVDTSASMSTRDAGPNGERTRLEQAIFDARAKIDDLAGEGEMRLVAFDEEVRQLQDWTSDRILLKDELAKLEPRHLRTRAQEAFETALALADEREGTEVLVLSDGCFDRLSVQKLLGDQVLLGNTEDIKDVTSRLNKFRFVNYGKDESDNVGITNIGARTRLVRVVTDQGGKTDALETQIFVQVENFRPQDQDVILALSSESGALGTKVVKLKARRRAEPTLNEAPPSGNAQDSAVSQEVFRLPAGTSGVVTARIASPRDAFPLDDQAQVVVGGAEGTRVLLVSKGNYFLEKSFAVLRGSEVIRILPEDFLKGWTERQGQFVEEYDAVVCEGVAPPAWTDGGAVFLGILPPLPGFKLREALPPGDKPSKDPGKLEWPAVVDWDVAHPVMRYVNFGNVAIKEAQAWQVPKTAAKLVESSGGPLIAALQTDRINAVGVAFEIFSSDWAYRPSLPLFLRNAVAWVAEASPRRRPSAQRTGEPLALPPAAGAPAIVLHRPSGATQSVTLSAEHKTFVKEIHAVGLYRATGWPEGPGGDRTYAVNLADANESDNAARASLLLGDRELKATPAAISSKREIWRWLALAAAGLLLAEWWVYHRRLGL